MIAPFIHEARPARVVFGSGTLERLPEEVARLGLNRVLVLATPRQAGEAAALAARLGGRAAGTHPHAVMHTPTEETATALEVVTALGVDGLVAVGGGSTTGLAKAIALRTDLPQIVVPTTYAGSEMTPILGETENGLKVTRSSPKVLPEVVIYDVDLTLTLPPALSGTSGINAIAHAVEALYARDANPVISLMALEAIGTLFRALPRIAADPGDRDARVAALYGAWLCGTKIKRLRPAAVSLCRAAAGRIHFLRPGSRPQAPPRPSPRDTTPPAGSAGPRISCARRRRDIRARCSSRSAGARAVRQSPARDPWHRPRPEPCAPHPPPAPCRKRQRGRP